MPLQLRFAAAVPFLFLSTFVVAEAASHPDGDFMFIYPTAFGPAIEFQDKTYGTGFGVDSNLVLFLKSDKVSTDLMDSYGTKLLFGNLLFYPGVALSYAGIGVPVFLAANVLNGWAYEDLGRAITRYNRATDKISFNLGTFGYRLSWDGQSLPPHDETLLAQLETDAGAIPFVSDYRSKSRTALGVGWASLLYPIGGTLLGFVMASGTEGTLNQGLFFIIGAGAGVGLGVISWGTSSMIGSSAEADLVQAVRVYNSNH